MSALVPVSARSVAPIVLYRDALQSILSFCTLSELRSCVAVCNDWRAAAVSLPSIDAYVWVDDAAFVRDACNSPLRHHLGRLVFGSRLALEPPELALLASRLTVHMLDCSVRIAPGCDQSVLFPASLRTLAIHVHCDAAGFNRIIQGIGLLSRLEKLNIFAELRLTAEISFRPLCALQSLTSLRSDFCCWSDPLMLSDAQAEELRSLPSLTEVLGMILHAGTAPALLHEPAPRWKTIPRMHLTESMAALLSHMPSLTQLRSSSVSVPLDFLAHLPALRHVDLSFLDGADPETALDLRHCAALEVLQLSSLRGLTSDHLAAVLPCMPRLHELRLFGLDGLRSLAFIAAAPHLSQTLKLSIVRLARLPQDEARLLLPLRALTSLTLRGSFTGPLSTDDLRRFGPPALPELSEFIYGDPSPPTPEGEEEDEEATELFGMPIGADDKEDD